MNIDIRQVPPEANQWTVTRKIAEVLHSEDLMSMRASPDERPTNFQVKLNDSSLGGVRNNTTGTLTLPSSKHAHQFMRHIRKNPIRIDGRILKFYLSKEPPPRGLAMTLEKTPYINPDIEEERQQKMQLLQDQIRVDEVQFGVFYRTYPKVPSPTKRVPPRAFSIECKLNYERASQGWLRVEYDSKLIRIEVLLSNFDFDRPFSHTCAKLGDRMTEQVGMSIAISFSSISELFVGYDGKPCQFLTCSRVKYMD
jgi:RNA-dependent RNA polymerase